MEITERWADDNYPWCSEYSSWMACGAFNLHEKSHLDIIGKLTREEAMLIQNYDSTPTHILPRHMWNTQKFATEH